MGILFERGSPARSVSIFLRLNTENSSIVRLLFVVYQHVVFTNTLYSRLFGHYTHVTNTKTTKTCVLHTTTQRLATGSAGRELQFSVDNVFLSTHLKSCTAQLSVPNLPRRLTRPKRISSPPQRLVRPLRRPSPPPPLPPPLPPPHPSSLLLRRWHEHAFPSRPLD